MHPVIQKTLGGLSLQYYFRHFFFGLLISGFVVFMSLNSSHPTQIGMWLFIVISTFLYPYARFVYESIADFIMGSNVFFVNAIAMLITKFISMIMCWAFSLFIAPIGFAYLYYHHSKAER